MPLGHKASNKILSNRFVNEEQSSILFYISLCIGIELGEIPVFTPCESTAMGSTYGWYS